MKVSFHFVKVIKTCPYVIRVLHGLESIRGLGTILRSSTPHCQVVTVPPKQQRWQRNYFKHDQICASSVEQGGVDGSCVWWDILQFSVHMVVRGRKGAGEADQAMPEGGWTWRRRGSTLRRDGILGPSAFMFHCLFLLAASSPATSLISVCLFVHLSDWQPLKVAKFVLISSNLFCVYNVSLGFHFTFQTVLQISWF